MAKENAGKVLTMKLEEDNSRCKKRRDILEDTSIMFLTKNQPSV
jgi:hypothetical protein